MLSYMRKSTHLYRYLVFCSLSLYVLPVPVGHEHIKLNYFHKILWPNTVYCVTLPYIDGPVRCTFTKVQQYSRTSLRVTGTRPELSCLKYANHKHILW